LSFDDVGANAERACRGKGMNQNIAHIAIVVRDYDDAIDFYVSKLGFILVEDSYQAEQDKRWVVVKPKGDGAASLLLARASSPHQESYIGDQAGGRVFLFLQTDDFWRDYAVYLEKGIEFTREPKQADYGIVAVFKDLYGNLWDLVQFTDGRS
jgi:catechol 2,3-dioxygenase-like lactoylglutathione lyase family enzyme